MQTKITTNMEKLLCDFIHHPKWILQIKATRTVLESQQLIALYKQNCYCILAFSYSGIQCKVLLKKETYNASPDSPLNPFLFRVLSPLHDHTQAS